MGRVAWSCAGLGWVAAVGGWWLGTHPVAAGAAAVLYAGSFLRGVPRVAALLLAPVALSFGPLDGVLAWQALAWVAVATAAVVPLFLALGGAFPWRSLLAWPVVAAALALLWLHPWSISLFHSDVAARAQVVVLAMVFLLASSAERAQRERNR